MRVGGNWKAGPSPPPAATFYVSFVEESPTVLPLKLCNFNPLFFFLEKKEIGAIRIVLYELP